jgi:hypothetical protein
MNPLLPGMPRLTSPVKPDVDPRIPQSCALLDEVLTTPLWDLLIDPETFDIRERECCVLGQTGDATHIPNEGEVPWDSYGEGEQYLMDWLDDNPNAAEKIGANHQLISDAFGAEIGYWPAVDHWQDGMSQNEQWLVWIYYRQKLRAYERQEHNASIERRALG